MHPRFAISKKIPNAELSYCFLSASFLSGIDCILWYFRVSGKIQKHPVSPCLTPMTAKSQSEAQNLPESAELPSPDFGWTQYAERINGRFAMIGFVALLITELVTGQNFFVWLELR